MRKLGGMIMMAAAAALVTGVASAKPARAQTAPKPETSGTDKAPWWVKSPVITQIGYVRTEVEANRAFFSASFQSVGKTPDEAQSKAIEQTKALTNVLKKLGAEKIRTTTSFSMRTLYEQYRDKAGNRIEDQRADKIEAYQVNLNLSFEVRDLSVLEKAYALVLAASPTYASDINFTLEPANELKTWLYTEAVKDARTRAKGAVEASGAALGKVMVIDPTSRACQTDVLARNFSGDEAESYANDVAAPKAYRGAMAMAAPPPPPAPVASAEAQLEEKALKNPFIQVPPLQTLTSQACVVYGVN